MARVAGASSELPHRWGDMGTRHETAVRSNVAPAPQGATLDCSVIIVAYQSAADVGSLLASLPAAAAGLSLEVLVVDNDSSDDLEGALSPYPHVRLIRTGANLGYSGGINVGLQHVGSSRSVLILNPDLVLDPLSLRRLYDAARQPGAGASVPTIRGQDGQVSLSLRREPSLSRSMGEALFGDHWASRPDWLSEVVRCPGTYETASRVDWATGAALMLDRRAVSAVGPWDDARFFLYSEETDYCRRLRQVGFSIAFTPSAAVRHRGGGSGVGASLFALMTVNKVRYFAKHHGPLLGSAFWCIALLQAGLRAARPEDRSSLRALLSSRQRTRLPGSRAQAMLFRATSPERTPRG